MAETFYIVTLHATKKNTQLLDANGCLRKDARRNIDYAIVPCSTWAECKKKYDVEIQVRNVYNLFISFSCHGLSYKNIYVHGAEVVFDVIQALFVNKMFGIETFRKMFEVRWDSRTIDPMVSFEWFGNSTKVVLTVERRSGYVREEPSGVLESIMVDDPNGLVPLPVNDTEEQSLGSSVKSSPDGQLTGGCEHRVTWEDISFYKKIYTSAREIGDHLEGIKHVHDAVQDRMLRSQASGSSLCVSSMHQESVGLANIGNTCYMNSSIQCLNNCMMFSNFFVYYHPILGQSGCSSAERPFLELIHNKHFQDNLEILTSWADLIMALNTQSAATPGSLKAAMGSKNAIFRDFKEQDAAEFIEAILTYLHECLCYKSEEKSDSSDRLSLQHHSDENVFSREFDNLINSEKSIVSRLFYGMYTNMMECRQCGFRKHKSDLMMILPLPIPCKVLYHPSITLIRSSGEILTKILAPLDFTIQDVLKQVKSDHGIRGDVLPVEYQDSRPVNLVSASKTVRSIQNHIHLYECPRSKRLCLCRMFHYRYLFFKSKLPIDILVEEESKVMGIFNRLRPYFTKSFRLNEFLSHVVISYQDVDRVYGLPVVEVVFKDTKHLFGASFEMLSRSVSQKSDDVDLRDCLSHCFKPESVELYCEGCGKIASYKVRSKLTKHPRYLIIHLKRFRYSIGGAKINTFVNFPVDNLSMGDHTYQLVGTSNHLEIGLGYGHYVSYVRKGHQWYCCNDSVISKSMYPDKSTAYILFYEKIH